MSKLKYILLIGLVIKFIFFLIFLKNNPCLLKFDAMQYHKVAVQIASGKGIVNELGNAQFYRVPGYPIFLATLYKLFGINSYYVLITQILLSIIISWLIFLLALTIFPRQNNVAMLSVIISCLDVGYLIFPGLIFTETIFVILFTSFLILLLRNLKLRFNPNEGLVPSKMELFLAGIFLGIACLVRQVAPAMLLTTVFLLLFTRKTFQSIIIVICGFILSTCWWLIRNYILTGYIFFGTLSGPHFLNHFAVRIEMQSKNITYEQAKTNVYKKFKKLCHQSNRSNSSKEIEDCITAENLTLEYLFSKPYDAIKLSLSNVFKTMFGLYSSELLCIDSNGTLPVYSNNRGIKTILKRFLTPRVSNKLIIPIIYFEMLLFLMILIGFFAFCITSIFSFNDLCIAFKTFPFIFATLFITLACGYARLRLPIECLLIILASKGWYKLKGVDDC